MGSAIAKTAPDSRWSAAPLYMSLLALRCSKRAKRDNSLFLSDHPMPSKQTTGRRGFRVRMMNRHLQRCSGLPSPFSRRCIRLPAGAVFPKAAPAGNPFADRRRAVRGDPVPAGSSISGLGSHASPGTLFGWHLCSRRGRHATPIDRRRSVFNGLDHRPRRPVQVHGHWSRSRHDPRRSKRVLRL